MKTSVTKIMMSFALMGCLVFSASDAMAQGRSRSQGGSTSSRSQSAAVSRPNKSTAPTVTRASSSVSRSASSQQVNRSSTPQVNRSSSTTTSRRSETTPQVNRSTNSGSSTSRSSSTGRTGNGASTRGGSGSVGSDKGGKPGSSTSGTGSVTRRSDTGVKHVTPSTASVSRDNGSSITGKTASGRNNNGGNIGSGKPGGNGGKPGNNGGSGKPGDNGGKPGNNGGSGKPGDNGGKPSGHNGGGHPDGNGFGPKHHYDYNDHHYRNEFSWNYSHHNWSRPLPPPARPYYLAPWAWYRPTIPAGWRPYAGAPVIDRILGLVFGTLYDASLDHLYYSGYYIDGYADGVIYLRDVPMLNLYWPDVMLNYDYNRLVNAQFVYHSSYYDTSRYNRVYRSLSRIYGPPVYRDGMTASWYGGGSKGYVTLSLVNDYGDYYTTMSIGY